MKRRLGTALAMAALLALAAGQALADPRSKWRIEFDHSSDNAGEIVLRITPENGQPIDVTTQIPDSTRENVAADLVRDSLKAALGKGYKIQTDDGEDVRHAAQFPQTTLDFGGELIASLERVPFRQNHHDFEFALVVARHEILSNQAKNERCRNQHADGDQYHRPAMTQCHT